MTMTNTALHKGLLTLFLHDVYMYLYLPYPGVELRLAAALRNQSILC